MESPTGSDDPAELRAQRDAWESRALEAEAIAERLADELSRVRAEHGDASRLSLFDEIEPDADLGRAADGSDPHVLSLTLAAVAVVMAMVLLLSLVNNGLFSFVTFLLIVLTAALAWGAWETRVVLPDVSMVKSVVLIELRGQTYRFDLRSDATRLEVVGRPGESAWHVRFLRRALDPLTVDGSMVDPEAFMGQLRQWRPDL